MKIVQVIQNLDIGGLQTFTVDLANNLSLLGNDVYIIVLEKNLKSNIYDSINPKVKIIFLNCKRLKINPVIFTKLYNTLNSLNPDIIHTHGITILYSFLSIIKNKNVFTHTIHNLAKHESGRYRRIINRILFSFKNVNIVTISNEVSKSFSETYINCNFFQIENGVTKTDKTKNFNKTKKFLESLGIDNKYKIITNVGRVDYQKNQELLINTFLEIKKINKKICLLILGDFSQMNIHFSKSIRFYNQNKIFFLGNVKNVSDYLIISNVFSLSSLFEGLPISLLEALSHGKICASTPAGGVKSVLKNNIGYVSKNFSLKEFKSTLIDAINNANNIKKTEITDYFNLNYSMKICAMNYFKLYNKNK